MPNLTCSYNGKTVAVTGNRYNEDIGTQEVIIINIINK